MDETYHHRNNHAVVTFVPHSSILPSTIENLLRDSYAADRFDQNTRLPSAVQVQTPPDCVRARKAIGA